MYMYTINTHTFMIKHERRTLRLKMYTQTQHTFYTTICEVCTCYSCTNMCKLLVCSTWVVKRIDIFYNYFKLYSCTPTGHVTHECAIHTHTHTSQTVMYYADSTFHIQHVNTHSYTQKKKATLTSPGQPP
jgi:hypothetical protein